MRIQVFNIAQAIKYIPKVRTGVIRIENSKIFGDQYCAPLLGMDTGLLRPVHTYFFDDIDCVKDGYENWSDVVGNRFMDKDAEDIIKDFRGYKDKIDELVVHCKHGQSRSPAVAIALNELFSLGEDSFILSKEYPFFNEYVYKTMMDVGKKIL
jgi:hypothetical protein